MREERGGEGDRREVEGGRERRELVHQNPRKKFSHLDNKHVPTIFQLCTETAS